MNKTLNRIAWLLVAMLMLLSLAACGGGDNASGGGTAAPATSADDTTAPVGSADDTTAPISSAEDTTAPMSPFFGLIDNAFSVSWDDVRAYDVISNIDYSTLRTMDDGSITFSTTAPDGSEMRFVGTAGVTVSEGSISFAPGSTVMALDSIGRICAYKPAAGDIGSGDNWFSFTGGYTFNGKTSVESRDELFEAWPVVTMVSDCNDPYYTGVPLLHKQPNMIGIGARKQNPSAFTISELTIYYDEATYATPLGELQLVPSSYGSYMNGEYYDPSLEVYDPDNKIYTFFLLAMPDLLDEIEPSNESIFINEMTYMERGVQDIKMDRFTIGELKNANGMILDKETDRITAGSTLEITLSGCETVDMKLPFVDRFYGAQTLNDLAPYANALSEGDVTALVIPIQWSDHPELANDDTLNSYLEALGRVVDKDGKVTDYSGDPADGFSLSSYYDQVSFGKYRITSFVSDWYSASYSFEEAQYTYPSSDGLLTEAVEWVKRAYPDMDWSRFDADADGILDAVIFIGASPKSNMVYVASLSGAIHIREGYTADGAGTLTDPALKKFIVLSSETLNWKNTIIHEFGHNFGLVDYYDVSYSGIDAVGNYDMQSSSLGDWNAYSKYAVGWIEPEIVSGLASGQSVEITIGAQSDTGDAIVIPAAGVEHDGPFGEYILVDLFTDSGLNEFDATDYGLDGVTGVRIYHVNARMELRELTGEDGVTYPIGTVHFTNSYNMNGKYLIELLQAGGNNTLTDTDDLRLTLRPEDFFGQGDVFDAADYSEFLVDGLMDDRSEFGYTIEIVSIDENDGSPTATVRITRQ